MSVPAPSSPQPSPAADYQTAQAFSTSWNNLPAGSVYTPVQFADWLEPLRPEDFAGKSVLEMGCGNGSLLVHAASWGPDKLTGIDLGDSVLSARQNTAELLDGKVQIEQADLRTFQSEGYDVVYSVGVLHHLTVPQDGLRNLINNTKPGGRFHGWVYGREGNGFVIHVVDPARRLATHLPWWFTKHVICSLLSVPMYVYGKLLCLNRPAASWMGFPLAKSDWIERNDIAFYRHILFDQLVTPVTHYVAKTEIKTWFTEDERIDPASTYITQRSGNSWRFGGRVRENLS